MKSSKRATNARSGRPTPALCAQRFPAWVVPVCVVVATLGAFFPALLNDFVNWDDDKILYDNPFYRGLGWVQLKWMFSTFLMGHYQPLTWLSFAIDHQFWGMAPFGYHLTSVLLHAGNAVMFYCVSRRLLRAAIGKLADEQSWRLELSAGLSALLFAIHPLRVESVAWATERRDVLSGFFYFITLDFYLRAVENSRPGTFRKWFGAATIAYLLSLLSKATAITLPVVLLLLDIYPLRRLAGSPSHWLKRESRGLFYEKFPFLILAIGFGIIALIAQQVTGALKPLEQFDVLSRLLQACFAYLFYLWKTIWPFDLAPIYELPIETGSWIWVFVFSTTAMIGVTLAIYSLKRRWPMILACWVYYIVVLAPVTGVAQSGPQLVADRYSYLACLAWPLLLAGGFFRWWPDRKALGQRQCIAAAMLLVVGGLGFLTWRQTLVWRSPISLWQHGTEVEPLSSIAHYNLGRAFERENNPTSAIDYYRRTLAINSNYSKAHFNLARLLALNGRETEAMAHYRRVIEIRPDHADAHNDIGLLLEMNAEDAAALAEFRKAIELEPDHQKALFNLAELLAKQGDLANAITHYEQAARLNPNEAAIEIRWAIALARQGQLESATHHFRRAVELNPADAGARVLLARSLAAQGKHDEAEQQYQNALRLSRASGKSLANP
jgi:tetratricopeptide (TPR) repeat protein